MNEKLTCPYHGTELVRRDPRQSKRRAPPGWVKGPPYYGCPELHCQYTIDADQLAHQQKGAE